MQLAPHDGPPLLLVLPLPPLLLFPLELPLLDPLDVDEPDAELEPPELDDPIPLLLPLLDADASAPPPSGEDASVPPQPHARPTVASRHGPRRRRLGI